jgi:hypothetical protein
MRSGLGLESGARGALEWQERLERSRAGRWLISVFLVVTVVGVVVTNLPAVGVQRRLAAVTQPFMVATGLDQAWNMFAPYPRRETLYLEARVLHADGRVTMWRPPSDGPLLGAYRDAHWIKFAEHATLRPHDPGGWPQLWRPLALYIASQQAHDGTPAVSVTLITRSAVNLPPNGSEPGRTPFTDQPYYTLRLR